MTTLADRRIVVVTDSGAIPSFYVRFADPIGLATQNYNVVLGYGPDAERLCAAADLIVAHRWFGPKLAGLIAAAQARGVPVVYETDDNLLDLSPDTRTVLPAEITTSIERILRAADLVVCSTRPLANAMAGYNATVTVIRNYGLDKPLVDPAGEPHLGVANCDYFKLGASKSGFFEALDRAIDRLGYRITFFGSVDPAMADLARRWPDRVTIASGLVDDRGVFLDRMHDSGINVGAVPLEHNRQHGYKSDIKYLDFGSIGVPGIYNNRDVYADVRHGVDGYLCDDDVEGWYAGLVFFADANRRGPAGRAARRVIDDGRSIDTYARRLAEQLADLLDVAVAHEDDPMMTPQASDAQEDDASLYWDGGRLYVRSRGKRQHVFDAHLIPKLLDGGLKLSDPGPARRRELIDGRSLTSDRQLADLLPNRRSVRRPARPDAMRIAWISPGLIIGGGGHRNIIRCAYQLERLGHDVSIYFVDSPASGPRNRELVREHFYPFDGHIGLLDASVADNDVVFATHWTTMRHAERYADRIGEIVYFVQDFEPNFYAMGSEYVLAEATYRKGHYAITSGVWCEQFLRERFGAEADHFQFPIDRAIYTGDDFGARRNRVLFFAKPEMGRRCFEIGVAALRDFHKLRPGTEIAFYGSPEAAGHALDFPVTQLGVLPGPGDLARLYGTSRVGLVFSTTNPSLVPYEMMACGLPVLDLGRPGNELNYGGRYDLARLADPDPAAMARELAAMIDDEDELAARRREGLAFTRTFPTEADVGARIEMLLLRRVAARRRPAIATEARA